MSEHTPDNTPRIVPQTWGEAFPTKYLKAASLNGKPATLTIRECLLEDLEGDKGESKRKAVVYFTETAAGLVLCLTNGQLLKAMWGPKPPDWTGHKVTLAAELVQMGAKRVPGLRIIGSPELAEPMTVSIELPRRNPFNRTLTPTKRKAAKPAPEPEQTTEPATDPAPDAPTEP